MAFDIRERAKKFGVRIVKLIKNFPKDIAGQEIGRQLIRSGTSVGANLEEADAASSRRDFLHRVGISHREAKESRFWLDIAIEGEVLNNNINLEEANLLRNEAIELSKILYSIAFPKGKNINDRADEVGTPCY